MSQGCNSWKHAGAKQVIWGDLHSEAHHFQPLFHFIATDIVFLENKSRLKWLPQQSRAGILALVATFLPYYADVMVSHIIPSSTNIYAAVSLNLALAHGPKFCTSILSWYIVAGPSRQ